VYVFKCVRGKGPRGRAGCVVPGVSAAVAIAAWLGRALAVGLRKLVGGLEVRPCDRVCRSLCGLTHPPSTSKTVLSYFLRIE